MRNFSTEVTSRGHLGEWYKLDAKPLFGLWTSLYPSEEIAISHAIWFGNITTRDKARSTRTKYESVRDRWVQDYTYGGKFLEQVAVTCYRCNKGWTFNEKRKPVACTLCDKGVYEIRSLYMHHCVVDGQSMYIKSYAAPERQETGLPPWEGYDVLGPSKLPMTGIMRVLSYVAVAKLDMLFIKGRYRPRISIGG